MDAVHTVLLLVAVGLVFASGWVGGYQWGLTADKPSDEEMSAAWSRGCEDCRCQRPL